MGCITGLSFGCPLVLGSGCSFLNELEVSLHSLACSLSGCDLFLSVAHPQRVLLRFYQASCPQKIIQALTHWHPFWIWFLRLPCPVHLEVYCNTKLRLEAACHTSTTSEHTLQDYRTSEFTTSLSEGKNASPVQSESE